MFGKLQMTFSPLVLCDCLITLAQQVDRAGHRESARRLIAAAHDVLDDAAIVRVS